MIIIDAANRNTIRAVALADHVMTYNFYLEPRVMYE